MNGRQPPESASSVSCPRKGPATTRRWLFGMPSSIMKTSCGRLGHLPPRQEDANQSQGERTNIGWEPQGRTAPPFEPVRPSEPPQPQIISPKGDTPKPSITTPNFSRGLKFMSLGEAWRLNDAERVEFISGRSLFDWYEITPGVVYALSQLFGLWSSHQFRH
jgi:hypothetical protein